MNFSDGTEQVTTLTEAMACPDRATVPSRPFAGTSPPTVSGRYPKAPASAEPVLRSEPMLALYRTVKQVAGHDVTVLVTGETGTGKELVAQTLHRSSQRSAGPLVAINCATLNPNLMCATLFGHERGAFTGADQRRVGVFEAAHGGSVFLDEVAELDAAAQAALLRVLETGRFTPVGTTREVRVEVRVIAATHRNLTERVRQGLFRSDLFYRLNAVGLQVPPLRERSADIEPLAERFLDQAVRRHDLRRRAFSPEALTALREHPWPGNVRELRNAVERAAILAQGALIELDDLPERLAHPPRAIAHAPTCACAVQNHPTPRLDVGQHGAFRKAVQAFERELIENALRATGGNRAQAAERLGMPRRTLLHKMRALGL